MFCPLKLIPSLRWWEKRRFPLVYRLSESLCSRASLARLPLICLGESAQGGARILDFGPIARGDSRAPARPRSPGGTGPSARLCRAETGRCPRCTDPKPLRAQRKAGD